MHFIIYLLILLCWSGWGKARKWKTSSRWQWWDYLLLWFYNYLVAKYNHCFLALESKNLDLPLPENDVLKFVINVLQWWELLSVLFITICGQLIWTCYISWEKSSFEFLKKRSLNKQGILCSTNSSSSSNILLILFAFPTFQRRQIWYLWSTS